LIRHVGSGDPPIVVLHGGWGYAFYPFDDAIATIPRRFVIPDRTGYDGTPLAELPVGFHAWYAAETEGVLDRLAIRRCVLWGHSDGAVIAAICAIRDPARYDAIVLEALHLGRDKPRSRAFFEMMANDPDGFGPRITGKLAAADGRWRDVLRMGGRAWLHIAATPGDDFFDRRLGELAVPTLVLHGADDPRTEPGELDRFRREVPHAKIEMIAGAGHSPHSERASAAVCSRLVRTFLAIALLAACGKSNDKPPPPPSEPASDEPPRVTIKELAAAKLETVEGTAGGKAFTIDLPKSLLKKPEVSGAYSTWEPQKAWFDTPDFTVQFNDMPMSPDSTGSPTPIGDDAAKRKIVRAEKLPDGGYINLDARDDKAFYNLEVCRPAFGGALCCTMIQRADKPIDGFADAIALGEKICRSMKPKS
jgi:3-oxoadipate enol-lactonase